MSRPSDWSPLRGGDPTPGDPDVVGDQARRLGDVAAELRAQVARLRRIGQDDDLRGQYADRLRAAATELVGDLEAVERRYDRVAAALRRWEPQLREAQQSADRIRGRARGLDEERRLLHRQAAGLGTGSLPDHPTPAQQAGFDADRAAAERIRGRLGDIDDELGRLDRELGTVEDRLHADGRAVAADIRAAADDGIADTTWEDVKGAVVEVWQAVDAWIDRNIDWIKKVVEVLSMVSALLGVVAMFVPGLNLIVVALTVGMVLVQGALYASGNGSSTELALAVFALATFGLGAAAGALIKSARNATRAVAAPRAGARAAASARAETRAAREALGRRLGQRLQPGQRAQTRAELDQLQARTRAEAQRRADLAEAGYVDRAPMHATAAQAVRAGGSLDNARFLNDIARTQRQFPTADVAAAGRWAPPALRVAQASWGAGVVSDVGSQLASQSTLFPDKPYSHEFEHLKQNWDPLR